MFIVFQQKRQYSKTNSKTLQKTFKIKFDRKFLTENGSTVETLYVHTYCIDYLSNSNDDWQKDSRRCNATTDTMEFSL